MEFNQLFELSPRKKLAITISWDFLALLVANLFAFLIRFGIVSWDFSLIDAVVIALNIAFALTL